MDFKSDLAWNCDRYVGFYSKFRYRVKNTADWTTVDADLAENLFSKEITGLTPGATYEYQAMDGEQPS